MHTEARTNTLFASKQLLFIPLQIFSKCFYLQSIAALFSLSYLSLQHQLATADCSH